jgi:PKD repeat protein
MKHILLLAFGLILTNAWAQFPPLEISADDVLTTAPATVEVPIRAGTNWQNITAIGGTITFDTTIITYDQISFFGLSNPSGATFTYVGGGVLTYQWFSLISIGPTLNNGDIVFTIQFNAVGNVGDVSPVTFTNLPQNEYWNNGFGWSGGFASTNGSVTIDCGGIGGGYTSAVTGNTACFTDTTAGGVAWQWDFGDGNTSTQQNPCHTYANPGNYTACLVVTDTCGNDTVCNNVYICGPPSADWTVNTNELIADFTDVSTNIPTSWLWDFGDGNTSTQQNPVYIYQTTGTYMVCLTITNPCGADSTCFPVTITCPTPTAAWTESNNGLAASFSNQSTGATQYLWDFGDGSASAQQNPLHIYSSPGTYTVCMIATNNCGSDSTCNSVTITCDLPITDWSETSSGYDATFTDLSTQNPSSWLWDFGDGNTSTQQNPTHTYSTPGTYTVCLTTTNSCGSDSTCYSVDIVCDSPAADWTQTTQGFDVSFTDQSTQGATSWLWDFGDGNTSTQQNPMHTYSSTGTYLVCLTSTNDCGSDSTCTNVSISDASIFEQNLVSVEMYPNPVENVLSVELPSEHCVLRIYDATNRLISQLESMGTTEIDTRDFARGLYTVKVLTESKQMIGKFIKN